MPSHFLAMAAAAAVAVFIALVQLYRLWKGPLSKLPGPTETKFTQIRSELASFRGNQIHFLHELHKKYGPVVRVGPSTVSVGGLEATRDIYKPHSGYTKTDFYTKITVQKDASMFATADERLHSRMRKQLSNPLSESNLKTMQSTVDEKVDLMLAQLSREHKANGHVDIFRWAHYFANDVIGTMSFGDSFHMLENGKENQYMKDVKTIARTGTIRVFLTGRSINQLPQWYIWPLRSVFETRDRMLSYATQSIERFKKRMADSPDGSHPPMLFSRILAQQAKRDKLSMDRSSHDDHHDGEFLTDGQIVSNAQGFIVAGTDTTAVTLTYIIYSIAQRPEVRAKLLADIAHLPENPTNEELKEVPYLENIIQETLRLYGAAPSPLPRHVPKGGRTLGGHFVPEGTTVGPVAFVLHRDPTIFADPDAWKPERWESPTDDMKRAFTAFGGGSRVCIGLHLAKMELRKATVAFFRRFPDAVPAIGTDGFDSKDMDLLAFFIAKPRGGRCLIK